MTLSQKTSPNRKRKKSTSTPASKRVRKEATTGGVGPSSLKQPETLTRHKFQDEIKSIMFIMGGCTMQARPREASDAHVDLGRAPYVLYWVKYIDLVSLI